MERAQDTRTRARHTEKDTVPEIEGALGIVRASGRSTQGSVGRFHVPTVAKQKRQQVKILGKVDKRGKGHGRVSDARMGSQVALKQGTLQVRVGEIEGRSRRDAAHRSCGGRLKQWRGQQ